jgi:hypothetical protein
MAGSGMWKMRNAENAGCGVERREEKRKEKRKDAYEMAVVSGYFQVLSLNMALNREWIWRGEAATGDGVIINFTTEGTEIPERHSRNRRWMPAAGYAEGFLRGLFCHRGHGARRSGAAQRSGRPVWLNEKFLAKGTFYFIKTDVTRTAGFCRA